MTNEPIEFAALNATRRTRAGLPLPLGEDRGESVLVPKIIDEVFAGFSRVDACHPERTISHPELREGSPLITERRSNHWQPVKGDLVAKLGRQLEALDRQREQLARLLQDIDLAQLAD